MPFKSGQTVRIPCEIEAGPFPDEYLVTIRTDTQVTSGFVKAEYLLGVPGPRGLIEGTVVEVTASEVCVNLPGSFFTTTGVTSVSPDWASSNLQSGAAYG